jgi:hypothetical protein
LAMRIDPLHIKPWVAGIAAGLFFGVVLALLAIPLDLEIWPGAVFSVVVGGVLTVIAIKLVVSNLQRRLGPAVEGLSPETARVAYRAARRGPVPAEPDVRAAALGIAERQLAGMLKGRIWLLIAGACVVLSQVLVALDDDSRQWWRFWPAAGMVLVVAAQFYQPKQLRRRIAQLREPEPRD